MRIRSIKPEFFKDEELAELPPLARLLFAGLWCMADCAGRIKSGSKRIKVEVLPYDDVAIDPLLIQLHEQGFIFMYGSKDGSNQDRFIQVIHFDRHQRITGKEAESTSLIPEYSPSEHVAMPVKQSRSTGETTGKQPDSLEGKGREGKGKVYVSGVSPNDIKEAFDKFWVEYPRKIAKEDALKAFKKHECWNHLPAILSAVAKHRASPDWLKEDRRFVPHPATWLNGKRWEDELSAPSATQRFTAPVAPFVPTEPDIDLATAFAAKQAREKAELEG